MDEYDSDLPPSNSHKWRFIGIPDKKEIILVVTVTRSGLVPTIIIFYPKSSQFFSQHIGTLQPPFCLENPSTKSVGSKNISTWRNLAVKPIGNCEIKETKNEQSESRKHHHCFPPQLELRKEPKNPFLLSIILSSLIGIPITGYYKPHNKGSDFTTKTNLNNQGLFLPLVFGHPNCFPKGRSQTIASTEDVFNLAKPSSGGSEAVGSVMAIVNLPPPLNVPPRKQGLIKGNLVVNKTLLRPYFWGTFRGR